MNDPAADFSRGGDGVSARQAGLFAVEITEVQVQGEHFTAAAADPERIFFIAVGFGGYGFGLVASRTDNGRRVIAADKGSGFSHDNQS